MNSSDAIPGHVSADITWVTISICGCDSCRATARIIYSLKMGGAGVKEFASVGLVNRASIRALLRMLLNITDGNSIS
jgi:hypothetical protein